MRIIGNCFEGLQNWLGEFSMEVFASVMKKEWIEEALEQSNRGTCRTRKLPALFTVWLLIGMGVYRNLSIKNVLNRMGSVLGVGSLWGEKGEPKSSSAVEARDRVGVGPLRYLVEKLRAWLLQRYREAMKWKGFLLLALDGTTFKVPDSEQNRRRFGLPGSSRGGRAAFPQMRAMFLVSAKLRFILGALFAPYGRGEMTLAKRMLGWIPKGALVLLDRNFVSYELIWGIRQVGSHFLIRAKQGATGIKGKLLGRMGRGDRLVEVKVPRYLRRRHPDMPKTMVLREIAVRVNAERLRLFTSLLEPGAYSTAELVELYRDRWEAETILDEMKIHQGGATTVNRPLVFRCKTSRRVLQEAYGLVLAYNLVRTLMADGADRADVPALRISFVDSLERIRSAALLMAAARTPLLPEIFDALIASIAKCVLPVRRDRRNPRQVCIKMSSYRKKWKPA